VDERGSGDYSLGSPFDEGVLLMTHVSGRRAGALLFLSMLLVSWAMVAPSAEASRRATAKVIDVQHIRAAGRPERPANCSNDDPSKYTGATETTGWEVAGATTAHLNAGSVPSYLGDVSVSMQDAFDAWLGGGVPRITVEPDGTVTKATANHSYDVMFGRSGSSIATAYTYLWSTGEIETDVVFNLKYKWFQAPEGDGCVETAGDVFDVENIAAHEFGHAYGLDHPAGARYETMYAFGFTGETLKQSPTPGEKSGLAAIY
jgi:hypothetical protein